jgi:hypothetical protein
MQRNFSPREDGEKNSGPAAIPADVIRRMTSAMLR